MSFCWHKEIDVFKCEIKSKMSDFASANVRQRQIVLNQTKYIADN